MFEGNIWTTGHMFEDLVHKLENTYVNNLAGI